MQAPAPRERATEAEPRLLHEWFTEAARRWPDRPAVDVPSGVGRPARRVVTYAEKQFQLALLAGCFASERCEPTIPARAVGQSLLLGEVAAMVVLESRDQALQRGAPIYGEVLGYGLCTDVAHIARPSVEGQSAAMRAALEGQRVFDAPHRSQRGRTITHAFFFHFPEGELPPIQGGDDAAEAKWVRLARVPGMQSQMFEDHYHIVDWFLGSG